MSYDKARIPFYLVQRLTAEDRNFGSGFDRLFHLDYMGAAEFEYGAIPASLKAIRAHKSIVIQPTEVTRGDVTRTVWFVGGKDDVANAVEKFEGWLAEDRPHSKEPSYFPEQFEGRANEWQARTDAWWALVGDVMFALDEATAKRLAEGIGTKVASR